MNRIILNPKTKELFIIKTEQYADFVSVLQDKDASVDEVFRENKLNSNTQMIVFDNFKIIDTGDEPTDPPVDGI